MTKQNRFYLLIAALSATVASSDATAIDCGDYYSEGENYQAIVDGLTTFGREYEVENDYIDNGFCSLYNCDGDDVSYDEVDSYSNCLCETINKQSIADYVCNGEECIQCVLGDDDPSGSDGYIGGSGGPSCSSGEWYNYSTNSCKTCDSHYNASASSTGGSGDVYSCYIPSGRSFTDTKGTGSFKDDCYYTDDQYR